MTTRWMMAPIVALMSLGLGCAGAPAQPGSRGEQALTAPGPLSPRARFERASEHVATAQRAERASRWGKALEHQRLALAELDVLAAQHPDHPLLSAPLATDMDAQALRQLHLPHARRRAQIEAGPLGWARVELDEIEGHARAELLMHLVEVLAALQDAGRAKRDHGALIATMPEDERSALGAREQRLTATLKRPDWTLSRGAGLAACVIQPAPCAILGSRAPARALATLRVPTLYAQGSAHSLHDTDRFGGALTQTRDPSALLLAAWTECPAKERTSCLFELLRSALERPGLPPAREALWPASLLALQLHLSALPDPLARADAMMRLYWELSHHGRHDLALARLESPSLRRAVEAIPGWSERHYRLAKLGQQLIARGRRAAGESCLARVGQALERAQGAQAKDTRVRMAYARALLTASRPQDALDVMREVDDAQLAPWDYSHLAVLADILKGFAGQGLPLPDLEGVVMLPTPQSKRWATLRWGMDAALAAPAERRASLLKALEPLLLEQESTPMTLQTLSYEHEVVVLLTRLGQHERALRRMEATIKALRGAPDDEATRHLGVLVVFAFELGQEPLIKRAFGALDEQLRARLARGAEPGAHLLASPLAALIEHERLDALQALLEPWPVGASRVRLLAELTKQALELQQRKPSGTFGDALMPKLLGWTQDAGTALEVGPLMRQLAPLCIARSCQLPLTALAQRLDQAQGSRQTALQAVAEALARHPDPEHALLALDQLTRHEDRLTVLQELAQATRQLDQATRERLDEELWARHERLDLSVPLLWRSSTQFLAQLGRCAQATQLASRHATQGNHHDYQLGKAAKTCMMVRQPEHALRLVALMRSPQSRARALLEMSYHLETIRAADTPATRAALRQIALERVPWRPSSLSPSPSSSSSLP